MIYSAHVTLFKKEEILIYVYLEIANHSLRTFNTYNIGPKYNIATNAEQLNYWNYEAMDEADAINIVSVKYQFCHLVPSLL